ncbi:MAG: TIGR04219 family outer membrane beta-barrel protein [Gammaproteobacteria bacterium]|nr:TIGR04219 family outer membrane beta-barrel protein [Gammaproteobacteria bacterium]
MKPVFTTLSTTLAATVLSATFSHAAFADRILGVFAGASQWNQNYDGFIRDLDTGGSQGEEIDFNNDLGLKDDDGNMIYVALEHPIPFLPNVKLQRTKLEIEETNTISRQFEYGDQTFNASDTVTTEADLSHDDLTMYFQVLDNWVSLDIGLTVRFFDGFVSIKSSTDSAREDFDSPVPLLYGKARFDLPLSGLSASLAANALGDGDNMFVDFEAAVQYEHKLGAGVELGFRRMDLDLDDIDDIEVDLTIDGAYFGVFYHL